MKRALTKILTLFLTLTIIKVQAEIKGYADLGAVYVHLDILQSNKTIEKVDLGGLRAEGCINFYKGFVLKPVGLYAKAPGEERGELYILSAGLGYIIPIHPCFSLTPSAGISYTHVGTPVPIPVPNMPGLTIRAQERFSAWAPYVALEAVYRFTSYFRTYAQFQYAWSSSRTVIKHIHTFKEHSQGPSYGLMAEYDLSPCWSVNIAAAYNISLSEEKHGIRARGLKFGVTRWF